jgi:enterochelin esterase-like enzyme
MVIYYFSNCQESKIEHFTFYSKSLEEHRKITVYFPENFRSENNYNAIFCTDGQFINEEYKNKLDSIFVTKNRTPFVIIGINSNEKEVLNSYFEYRNFEYLENMLSDDPDLSSRFERHMNFFVYEVDEYIKDTLQLRINSKFFYGVSNGAAFGISISKQYPELFSKYILYSIAGGNYKNLKWNSDKYPFFIIRYGRNEPKQLIKNNKAFSKHLSRNHYQHIFKSYNGGHNREDWLNLFIKDIEKL